MMTPLVEPKRVRVDLVLLQPDLHRPGIVMGLGSAADDGRDVRPALLVERLEHGLADVARRYRWMLTILAAILLSPGLLAWAAWGALWLLPSPVYEPFQRGYHLPGIALYEAVAFAVLLVLMGLVTVVFTKGLAVLKSMAPDYRRLRDETSEEWRAEVALEASSGRWPRAAALMTTAAPLAALGQMVRVAIAEHPGDRTDEAGDR